MAWIVVVVMAFVLAPAPGLTQADKARAQALATSARILYEEGDLQQALELFQRAYELDPDPMLKVNIARVCEKMGDLRRARAEYEAVLSEEGLDPALRTRVQDWLSGVLRQIPGSLVLRVTPADARVRVDGRAVVLEQGRPIPLLPGTHTVEASRDGYKPQTRNILVGAEEAVTLSVELEAIQAFIQVDCDCPGARVIVDGAWVGRLPLDGPQAVAPGSRTVEVVADGHEPWKRVIAATAGATIRVPVTLKRVAVVEGGPSVSPTPKPSPGPSERTVRVPLSLSISEGFARISDTTYRTNVGMGLDLGLRFRGAPWLVPGLGLWWTLESPVNVVLRPGIQWYFGSFPMYVRTALSGMMAPEVATGFLAGLGGDIPLWKNGFLALEMTVTVWPGTVVPVDFRIGVGHAF
jgi:hypothetical protein